MPTSDDPPSYQFTPVCQRVLQEHREKVEYRLILRQQPKQSRMCGVGEKADRRPIDPPPIVQLIVKTPTANGKSPFTSYLQNPYYFMHASLVEKDSDDDVLLIKDTTRSKDDTHLFKDNRTKATTGSSVSSLYPLKDFEDNGQESGFFVFPDLSVRMEGTYRLKFCLYEMVGKDVHFCACITSDPLVVYSAKKFPGMEESTQLSQHFAEQGLKIRIRKEVRPKKRSRSGYLPGPTSLSPKEPLQRDGAEPSESYDEDEQSLALNLPLASKRRASGARATESRKEDVHGQTSILESRSNQSVRGGAQWRVQAQPHKDIPSQSDKPRSAPDSLSQQKGYFESTQSGPRRSSGTNRATEGMSHMNLNPAANSGDRNNSNLRSEQWMDEYRQDRGLAISPSSRHDSSSTHGHSMDMAMDGVLHPTSVDGQASDQMVLDPPSTGHYSQTSVASSDARPRIGIQECSESTEGVASTMYSRQSVGQHQEGVRRPSGSGQRREVGQESTLSASQGMRSPQRHSRDHPQGSLYVMHEHPMTSHSQSFPSRSMPSESHYSYAQRQGYASSGGYRSVDYGASGSYTDDSHRGSVSSNPYDRSDYPSRSQADTPSHFSASFHASGRSSHYPPAPVWEQQHSEGHLNEQQSAKARPSSYHDPYPVFKQQTASDPPHPLSHGKYHGVEGMDPSHSHNEEGHCSYTNKCAKNQLAPPSHVRYPSQGHSYSSSSTAPPKEHSHREDPGTIRKLSLTTSPTRPHEHRSQSLPHLTNVPPQPPKSFGHPPGESFSSGGFSDFNREHEEDSLRQPSLTSSGPFLYQDSQGQSLATPPTSGHFVRGNPGPYTSHIQESTSTGGVVSRTSAFEHGPDGRPAYGHGRSMSSSNIHRSIYPAGSTASGPGHPAGVGVRSTNPPSGHGQIRGSQYDSEDSVQGGHSAKSFLVPHSSSDHYRVHNGGRTHLHDTIHAAGHVPSGMIQTKGPHPPQSHPQHESHQHSQYQRLHPMRYHSQHFPEPSPQHGSHSHPPTYPSQHNPGVHDNYGPPTVVQSEEGTRWPI